MRDHLRRSPLVAGLDNRKSKALFYTKNVSETSLKSRKEATADVGVAVRGVVVVHIEQTVIQVLVIVPAAVQTRVRGVEVPVIRGKQKRTDRLLRR